MVAMEDETTVPATENSSNPEPKKSEASPAENAAILPVLKPDALPAPAAEPELPPAPLDAPVPVSAATEPPVPEPVPAPIAEIPKSEAAPDTTSVPKIIVPPKNAFPQASASDKLFGGNAVSEKAAEPAEKLVPVTRRAEMRGLREVGIAERPETAGEAPERYNAEHGAGAEASGIPTLRTYAADMAEEIKKRGETLSTIVSAEQLKNAETAQPEAGAAERKSRIMLMVGAALFVLAGIAVVAGIILVMTAPKPATYRETTLVPANETVVLAYDAAKPLADALAVERGNAQMNLGEVENIPVSKNGAPVSAQDILSDLGAPDALARNAIETMVGLHAFNRTQPFILVRVSAYDLAFQAMLQWEPTMARDLGAFFAPSGPTAATAAPAPFTFTDRVSQNVDTRVSDPSWPILYAFPQKDLLLITTNESTLKEVLTRLASGKSSN